MQSSSLLPAVAARSFRLRAPRTGPHPAVAGLLLVLALAGLSLTLAVALPDEPWLGPIVTSVRARGAGWLPLGGESETGSESPTPIAMPVRVPLDPVSVVESAPVAVAEASGAAPLPRPESGDAPPPAEEATAAPTPSADPQVSAAAAAPSAADEPR